MRLQKNISKLTVGLFMCASALFAPGMAFSADEATSPAVGAGYEDQITLPKIEFYLGLGSARPSGYLTTEKALGSYLFALHLVAPRGLFAFEFGGMKARHDTNEFGLANNVDVNVSTFSWMSYINVFQRPAITLSLGIGPVLASLSQSNPDNYVTYGTFVVGGLARHQFNDQWSVQLKSQWYKIEQVSAGTTTRFDIWNNNLGVAYGWK